MNSYGAPTVLPGRPDARSTGLFRPDSWGEKPEASNRAQVASGFGLFGGKET